MFVNSAAKTIKASTKIIVSTTAKKYSNAKCI